MVPTSETAKGECYVTLPGIIEVFSSEATDVENLQSSDIDKNGKYVNNGSLYIKTGDKTYNVLGAPIK
jgi:hypothetical protein